MQKIFLVIVNLILLLLNIPLDQSSLSIIGLILFMFGIYFIVFCAVFIISRFFQQQKNYRAILVYIVSLIFFVAAKYWDILAMYAVDFSSFDKVSIWYRLGPSLFFTFGVLLSLDFWYCKKFLANPKLKNT